MKSESTIMVSNRLRKVILEQLNLDDFELLSETVAYEVPGWDSLRHIAILTAIENEFKIRFSTFEILRLKNLGELQALTIKKIQ